MNNNPLLRNDALPPFREIQPEHIMPALDQLLANNRSQLNDLLKQEKFTWKNLISPLEKILDGLNNMWSPVRHLHAVVSSKQLREVYNEALPKLSEYSTELGQNLELYNAVKSISESEEYQSLSGPQKKVIDNKLRDFRLSGVHLAPEQKKRLVELELKLSKLTTQFEENVLDATQNWNLLITDEAQLSGIPAHAVAVARQTAERQGKSGWLFTLEMPSYRAVALYADSRLLREQMYYAYVTRASDQGPDAHRWDNSPVMDEILQVRHEIAQLLGFNNFAELSIASKMAESTQQVLNFLNELADASLNKARQEFTELSKFANESGHVGNLEAWDVTYFSEKLRQHTYAISEEELRPYFPEDSVLKGLFEVACRLFGAHIKEEKNEDVWHKDVRFFSIYDQAGKLRAHFYLDLYSRTDKRSGAWMDDCRSRLVTPEGRVQIPVCYLTCNFGGPVGDAPALFTHDEVLTLFHEFGHGLQHMLTTVDYAEVSGINGVPWDAVELASQFMENWCWQKPALDLFAKHYKSHESLPEVLHQRLYQARNFESAMDMIRQLIFAVFDFRLHVEFNPKAKDQVQKVLDEVRTKISVMPAPHYNRFQHSFTHVFGGSYAAGYYSYKWAEVLASDAFGKFEETGIFNSKTGEEFLHCILETGGTEDPMDLFIKFRGRPPQIEALLKQSGIV